MIAVASRHRRRRIMAAMVVAACAWSGTLAAQSTLPAKGIVQWVTLGTNSGPLAFSDRAQPANLLVADGQYIVVDAGDGASESLLRKGVFLDDVHAVFISHLHFDHTGGLFALLGRRYQARGVSPLTIYGPPGTKRTVDALIAAMQPMAEAEGEGGVFSALAKSKPGDNIKVVELVDGSRVKLGNVNVSAAVNTHYVLSDETGKGNHSLAFRFDAPGRSIAYTGDTGPSKKVEALAKNADLLVSEIMDPDESLDRLSEMAKDLNFVVLAVAKHALRSHFVEEHLSPDEVGLMAKRANVKSLLLTHNALAASSLDGAHARIAKNYSGPITFAEDMHAY
ncbi:MBL fold metallo-hydrolase [Solimonas terrae]|nr:MBL fold metallo-hydrolase [Solimonas terrae]